jgi:hypothetical protein
MKKITEEIEEEGWKGSKTFFKKMRKIGEECKSIRKIPEKYRKAGQNEYDLEEIKDMIRNFW